MTMEANVSGSCYIVGAGEFCSGEMPGQGDYIIAADGGFASLAAFGIEADLVIGDFDSLGIVPSHPNVIISSPEKNDTDVMLAVRKGLALGYKSFLINGGMGGRPDHTLANIQVLLYLANNGANGVLIGSPMCVTIVKDGSIRFPTNVPGGLISVFCAGERADGVALKGLKYPLDDVTLTNEYPLGISNEFTGVPATVVVDGGALIVLWEGSAEAVSFEGNCLLQRHD